MAEATGEADRGGLRVDFDAGLRLEFHGSRVTSDAGLLAFRELDDALGLIELAGQALADSRTGRNSHLLRRPVGRPPNHVQRFDANFTYRAGSWSRKRRVVAKVEWYPGELYPQLGFLVTNLARPAERVVAFYNKRGTAEQWIKEGKNAVKWTPAVVPHDAGQHRSASTPRPGLQHGQLPAHPGASARDGTMVADVAARKGGQDRGQGRRPRALHHIPDGRGRRAARSVQGYPGNDRRPALPTGRAMLMRASTKALLPPTGEVRPKIGPSAQTGAWAASGDASRARLLQRSRRGSGQCGHVCQTAAPDWQMGRLSGECRFNKGIERIR